MTNKVILLFYYLYPIIIIRGLCYIIRIFYPKMSFWRQIITFNTKNANITFFFYNFALIIPYYIITLLISILT